jgi:hypothetical protein
VVRTTPHPITIYINGNKNLIRQGFAGVFSQL